MRLILLFLTMISLAGTAAAVDEAHTMPGVKTVKPPVIDGVIDVAGEWAGVPMGTGFTDTEDGSRFPVETQFRIAYDERFIYFAAQMRDPSPNSVRATEYRTNVSLEGDDHVALYIDAFGKMVDSNEFAMNRKGATNVEVAGGRAAKREWLGEFVAKGRITEEGWEVEARIPWAIMRLPSAGKRDLRFNVMRYYSRTQRYAVWSYVKQSRADDWGRWSGVELPKVDSRRTLKLLPFGYVGAVEGGSAILDGGLDLKASLTDQIEFVGSMKPDFRNIENQILSLDYSHFERIADDSRPFFMEGADYFELGGDQKLFISQRIPDFDVGAKAYGKLDDKTSFGVLNMTTFGEWNAFVGSGLHAPDAKTQIEFGGTSFVKDGERNETGRLTYTRSFGPVEFYASNMWSFDRDRGQGRRSNTGFFSNQKGLYLYGEYVEVSPDFHPAIGYSPEQGLKGVNGSVDYTKPTSRWGLSEAGVGFSGVNYQGFDGKHYRSLAYFSTTTTWKDGTDLDCAARFERYGGYDDRLFTVSLEKPRNEPYRNWNVAGTWGRIEDSDYSSVSLTTNYRPVERLQLGGRFQLVEHREYRDQAIFTANYDLGRDEAVSGRMVKTGDDWNAYLAYRRSGNRGTEYYLILGDPNARSFRASAIFKVTVPFEFPL